MFTALTEFLLIEFYITSKIYYSCLAIASAGQRPANLSP